MWSIRLRVRPAQAEKAPWMRRWLRLLSTRLEKKVRVRWRQFHGDGGRDRQSEPRDSRRIATGVTRGLAIGTGAVRGGFLAPRGEERFPVQGLPCRLAGGPSQGASGAGG